MLPQPPAAPTSEYPPSGAKHGEIPLVEFVDDRSEADRRDRSRSKINHSHDSQWSFSTNALDSHAQPECNPAAASSFKETFGSEASATGHAFQQPMRPTSSDPSPFSTDIASPLDCRLFQALFASLGISESAFGVGILCCQHWRRGCASRVDAEATDVQLRRPVWPDMRTLVRHLKTVVSVIHPTICVLLMAMLTILVMVFNERTYGVVNNIADTCLYIWPIYAFVTCTYNHVRFDGHRKALQSMRLHLASEHAQMVALGEPTRAIEEHVKRSHLRLVQARLVERSFFVTVVVIIGLLWVTSNLRILVKLPHAFEDGTTGSSWDSKPQSVDQYMVQHLGQWYSVFLLTASLLDITAVVCSVSSAITGTVCDLQVATWLVSIAVEMRANKRSAAWQDWLEQQIRLVRRTHRRRLVFSKALGYAAVVLVGIFTAIYMGLFLGTLGKYPTVTVFVFPALHVLAFSLLAAIEYKFEAQMYRLEVMSNADARRASLLMLERGRAISAAVPKPAELHHEATDVSLSILEHPAPPVQQLDSVLDDPEMETTQPCCDFTAGLPSTPQAGGKSAEPVQHAFAHQSAHGSAGGASSSETADNPGRVSSSEATLQTADTDRKFIAQGHTFGTVLAHWPRQMLDAIVLSCAFLVVIAVRAFVAYPLCGVPVKDINYFALPKRDSCGSGEWIAAAVENSVMAYGCVFPTIAVTAKLLGPELTEMSRKLRVTGSILTLICITATLTITVTVDSYQALEFPFAAAAVLYMLYCAVLFSRQTMLPVYGHLFFWVWITGVLFRELSYWIIGPLYATSAGARVTIVNVFHPLINLGTLAVSRRLMVDLLHQTGSAVTHSAPRFFLLYLGWSLLLAITGRFYLANLQSLESQIVAAVLYSLLEAAHRLSVAPRYNVFYSALYRGERKRIMGAVREQLTNGFLVQCLYIDQFVELVGIVVAFAGTIIIRVRFDQDLHLSRFVISLLAQVILEVVGDVTYSLWEAGILGFRKRVALWRLYQTRHSYLMYAFVGVLASPLFTGLWVQIAMVEDVL